MITRLVLVAALAAQASALASDVPKSLSETVAAWGPAFTFQELQKRATESGARSVEDVLALIPESYRAQYGLVVDSQSAQPADLGGNAAAKTPHPRLLLFGGNGAHEDIRFVASFNTNPASRGFNRIEIMQWDPVTETEQFADISVEKPGRLEFHYGNNDPVIRQNCLGCHAGARAVFETAPAWSGMITRTDNDLFLRSREKPVLDALLASWDSSPRLRLAARPKTAPVDAERELAVNFGSDGMFDGVSFFNAIRLARSLVDLPNFARIRYALLAVALEGACGAPEQFLPAEVVKSNEAWFGQSLAELTAFITRQHAREAQDKELRYRLAFGLKPREPIPGTPFRTSEEPELWAALRFIAEPEGARALEWSTSPDPTMFTFEHTGEQFFPELIARVLATDAGLAALYTTVPSQQFCDTLRAKSLAAYGSAFKPAVPPKTPEPAAYTMHLACQSCHVAQSSTGGPALPFMKLEEPALRKLLSDCDTAHEMLARLTSPYPLVRMPPSRYQGVPFTDADRAELVRYFKWLALPGCGSSPAPTSP